MMPALRVLSLGAGVQSTTLALMAAHGQIGPMPDCAIFADTQAEPAAVYEHLRWLMSPNVLPFPVHVVTAGNLTEEIARQRKKGKRRRVDVPAYVKTAEGVSIINRSCTRDFKIAPVEKKIRELTGYTRRKIPGSVQVEQWLGISVDEKGRMKESRHDWLTNRWPLIEERMTRGDCLEWMRRHGYPRPPKSSCVFCPFHSNAEWRALAPVDFASAIEVDDRLREYAAAEYHTRGALYLHRSAKPLRDVDFIDTDPRQEELTGLDYNECEGMCGV